VQLSRQSPSGDVYNLSISIARTESSSARLVYQATNSSTLASATHLPLYGLIPGYGDGRTG